MWVREERPLDVFSHWLSVKSSATGEETTRTLDLLMRKIQRSSTNALVNVRRKFQWKKISSIGMFGD
ncbi:hypothetical protein LSTR_LSTR015365 [Laodelphax striatellus]|uniref:Uncharacterized protein n=1 Tax=Laodelphax striatellus TaxID=195883 RepID=A0A482WIR4_LAOST|nr:hypothetical protein LSTR_LSTR015365 [Laodelphax striatellus]